MKALNEYILMILFVLLLKRVHFLSNETQFKGGSYQMKALMNSKINMVLVLLLKRVHLLSYETQTAKSLSYERSQGVNSKQYCEFMLLLGEFVCMNYYYYYYYYYSYT